MIEKGKSGRGRLTPARLVEKAPPSGFVEYG